MTGVEFEVIFDDGGDFNVDFDQGEPQSIEFDEEIVINGGGGGASSLSDLDDVELSSPSDGQVLGFDADTGKWTNQNAGGGAVDSVNGQTGTVVLDAGDLGYDENETYSSGTVGDAITDLKSDLSHVGLTDDIKDALLDCFAHVAWADSDGQDYYDALEDALYPLDHIGAVYTQSGTVYDTATLESLKTDLVVTAYYEDNTSEAVTDYTLSGTLTVGTSTITVTYREKTTTFTVTVTATPTLSSISAVYTQSGTVYDTDSLDSLKTDLVVTATYSDTSTETVASTDYTLSGTLTAGTSTITVTYQTKTTTFNVTVTEYFIPSEYQQVAYIEAARGPVIDTLVTLSENSEVHAGVQMIGDGGGNHNCIFGATTPSVLLLGGSSTTYMNFARATSATASGSYLYSSMHDVILNKDNCKIDGTTRATFAGSPSAFTTPRHMLIFAFPKDDNQTPDHTSDSRCSYMKIYDNGSLIAELYPCYRKSDNVIGMYDRVARAFRTNVGTGSFTKGDDV